MSGRSRVLRWAIPLAVVPVLVLLAYGFRTDPREISSPLVGKPAAPFALTAFDGASGRARIVQSPLPHQTW